MAPHRASTIAASAFTYANLCYRAHYASNCDVGASGTSDRQDGPLEMQTANNNPVTAQRSFAKPFATNRSSDHFGSYITIVSYSPSEISAVRFCGRSPIPVEVPLGNVISREINRSFANSGSRARRWSSDRTLICSAQDLSFRDKFFFSPPQLLHISFSRG